MFVGMYRGIIIPGFLRCEMDFVHPQSHVALPSKNHFAGVADGTPTAASIASRSELAQSSLSAAAFDLKQGSPDFRKGQRCPIAGVLKSRLVGWFAVRMDSLWAQAKAAQQRLVTTENTSKVLIHRWFPLKPANFWSQRSQAPNHSPIWAYRPR